MVTDSKHKEPLVSIMMPAFNAGKTIRFALASLIAQSYKNWECLVVDDGSCDDTFEKARSTYDRRIRIIRLDKNLGGPVARQKALEESRGEFLGMLDADDWIFPDKLEKQVDILLANPDVSLTSCGMAIAGQDGNLVGIRAVGTGQKKNLRRPGKVPLAHAPSLLRIKEIGQLAYDIRLRFASDSDFLRRYLFGRNYIILPDIGYCYSEIESAKLPKVLAGYICNIRGLVKYLSYQPFCISWEIAMEMCKYLLYFFLGSLGLFEFLIRLRSRPPDKAENERFLKMRAVVQSVYDGLCGTRKS